MTAPNPPEHDSACEKAETPGCECGCHGASHQSNVLREAVRTKDDVPTRDRKEPLTNAEFDDLLTEVFGQQFNDLDDPVLGDATRRKWDPDAKTGGKWSRREQRIVDVTLRDVLAFTFALPDPAKRSWLTVLNALTLKDKWMELGAELDRLGLEKNAQSGYFWSALLAALSHAASQIAFTEFSGTESVANAIHRVITQGKDIAKQDVPRYDVFGLWCYPRQKQSPIAEINHPEAVRVGAELIADAAALAVDKGLNQHQFAILVQIVGSAVSADLWHQPASVRYLLIPAVTNLRALARAHDIPDRFSLDGLTPDTDDSKKPPKDSPDEPALPGTTEGTVEHLIAEELGTRWRTRQHWGPRDQPPRGNPNKLDQR
ncbi:Uncharacterised protein [Mycobacteroides abscessus subsp. massiliense]|uniref:hypothetical protein n=1 Tax=Mycobacteroides abscessus TaxID=36809 RepID=UPI0009A632CA|nr:hypothetical protein [Mycobacteroides abscessus]SLG78273.1 Uncharacterised protein [Mycobacteroides abscessus subsp. massiliense]SLI16793.1 Uncharacterised protein [Mycobacteroides abscessus subsp. massiliense]